MYHRYYVVEDKIGERERSNQSFAGLDVVFYFNWLVNDKLEPSDTAAFIFVTD